MQTIVWWMCLGKLVAEGLTKVRIRLADKIIGASEPGEIRHCLQSQTMMFAPIWSVPYIQTPMKCGLLIQCESETSITCSLRPPLQFLRRPC